MLKLLKKNKPIRSLVFAMCISAIFLPIILTAPFENVNHRLSDSLYTNHEASNEVTIIAIDSKSTRTRPNGLGYFTRWTRNSYTSLLDVLYADNPSVIAFDIGFIGNTETVFLDEVHDGTINIDNPLLNQIDSEFSKKLAEFEDTVIAFYSNQDTLDGTPIYPLDSFIQNTEIADISNTQDLDDKIRRISPNFYDEDLNEEFDSFALKIAKMHLGVENIEPELQGDKMLINYFGPEFSFEMISFVDVLDGQFDPGTFTDKIVLIGVTDFKQNQDSFATPTTEELLMPGVEIWANAVQTILEEKYLVDQGFLGQLATIFIIAFALTLALSYTGVALSAVVLIAAIIAFTLSAHAAFRGGTIFNMINPYLAILATFFASWMYRYFVADRSKREITSAFGHYVSSDLVAEISKNPEMVKLGGERKLVTVLFSDVKNSTTYSESVAIEAWVSQINEYFTEMESVIKKAGGTLDKYEGDAIMAFWNAPVDQLNHTMRAHAAALGMKNALQKLHAKWAQENKPLIEFRVGINTGEALVGNFGSVNRFDYTVMGDTVNTASRLESAANKAYNTRFCVAGFEQYMTAEDQAKFIFRQLDTVLLPGKNEPVVLYELMELAGDPNATNTLAIKQTYEAGLQAYRAKDFATAAQEFTKLPNDEPAKIMLARCQALSQGQQVSGLDENMVFRIEHK